MKSYWKCQTANDAVGKVVVKNNPKSYYDFKVMVCYYGQMEDAIDQFNRWHMCDSHKYGVWDSVELFQKKNGKWNNIK